MSAPPEAAPHRSCEVVASSSGAGAPVSFRGEILPLFGARCNFGGCHLGIDEPGQLRLGPSCEFDVATSTCRVVDGGSSSELAETIHANLLDDAIVAPRMPRVAPGLPEGSFVLFKLSGCQDSDPERTGCDSCGNPMPPGAPLRETSPDLFDLLVRWIAAGAVLD